ncbi:MAG: cysteine--tRNA ligase [Patescibacteria group bacterium]|jgi:cysteinyl-tRNA synthetase
MIAFFNTLTRKKQEFVPIQKGRVTIYSCGPTVYDFAHIGNLSSFLFVDFLRRWLEYRGFEVKHVMNLTDVDDKTIRRSQKEGVALGNLTKHYSQAFFNDLKILGIKPAHVYPRATEHILEMVALIKELMVKGHAYTKDGSIYYRISSFPTYGELAHLDKAGMRDGASGIDTDEYKKDDARDFVLWKAWKPDEDGNVYWDVEIGRGRPGWHIECSAMSMKHLGQTIDIHTGGVDLIFPHHQNEIAQSEGATGQKFVNYWLHCEHLLLSGTKMSKSAGTIKVLSDIVATPLDALAFRFMVFASHYRATLNFTSEVLEAAKKTVIRLGVFYSSLLGVNLSGENQIEKLIDEMRQHFIEGMDDDLKTSKALPVLFEFVNTVGKMNSDGNLTKASADAAISFLNEIDNVLGVIGNAYAEMQKGSQLTPTQQELIEEREEARKSRNWENADAIRDELLKQGIQLEDVPEGTKWRVLSP